MRRRRYDNVFREIMRQSALALLAGLLCEAAIYSQPAKEPTFEVASVKPSAPAADGRGGRKGGGRGSDPGLFSARNRTLNSLILTAYGIQDYQVAGGPGWIGIDRFDVQAKPPEAASRDRMLLMLRTLLSERFELRFHHETKTVGRLCAYFGQERSKIRTPVPACRRSGPDGGDEEPRPGSRHFLWVEPYRSLPRCCAGIWR